MSLHKTYRVECNGPQLAARLGRLGVQLPPLRWNSHEELAPAADETQVARRRAISAGWIRQQRDMPIFHDQVPGPTSKIAYDLCPSCAEHLGELDYPR